MPVLRSSRHPQETLRQAKYFAGGCPTFRFLKGGMPHPPTAWDLRLAAHLALAFSDNGELHAQNVQDRLDGFEAWMRARTQRLMASGSGNCIRSRDRSGTDFAFDRAR